MTNDLNKALRKAISTTSWLWDHIHIEVGAIDDPFHVIGDAEINGGPMGPDRDAYLLLAKAKSAGRKAMDWMVNGESGLKSIIQPANIYLSDQPFTNEDIEQFAWGVPHSPGIAHRATAFMMTRKQFRAIHNVLIDATPGNMPTMFGRTVIVNDYIDHEDQDIWGLNLSPDGLHLWETEEGVRKEDGGDRVLWDIGLGYKLSSDVTVMRQA